MKIGIRKNIYGIFYKVCAYVLLDLSKSIILENYSVSLQLLLLLLLMKLATEGR